MPTAELSPMAPCNGGIIAPPKIIMIKNAEPWLVYFPNPPTPKENIQGHITEQQRPPAINEYTEINPLVNTPINIAAVANAETAIKVLTGFSCP